MSLILLAGLAAGCSHGNSGDHVAPPPPPPPPPVVAAEPAPAPVHPKKPHVPAVAKPQIDEVIGWNETEIRTVFGAPTSQEDQAPTKKWLYHAGQCTMNVTLYPEVQTRQFQALNYEVNADDGSAKRQQACIAEFSAKLPAKPVQ